MSGIIQALIAAYKATDSFFNRVTLLLSTLTTNGAQNNTFLDSSSNNYTVTRNGNSTQGTFTPFSQTGWSNYFNGSTDYLTVTDTAGLRFGSGNFTIEAWVYRNAAGAVQTIASKGAATPTGWVFQISAADKLVFTDTSTSITGATSLAANTWYYVAVVRAGTGASQTTVYLNATSDATGTSATNFSQTSNMLVGADRSSVNFFNGYISNLRLSNTNRTISSTPTTPLTADANTIFLASNINRFQYTDSTAAYTNMAVTGTPSVQVLSPFAPTSAYSTSVVGGSGYFDGSADYLDILDAAPLQFGSGTFTINCWVYRNVVGSVHTITAKGSSTPTGWVFQINASNQLVFTDTSTSITSTTTIPAGAWTYVSVVRSGTGTNQTVLYINAVSSATGTSATNFNQTNALKIGADRSNANTFNGYISGFEYIKGSALTPSIPTAPPSTSNSPSLLLNYTNAGIYDSAAKNDFETNGNAQVSTTQTKFGTTSMSFDGTGDYLFSQSPNVIIDNNFGNGNYTIEFWLYMNTTPTANSTVVCVGPSLAGAAARGWAIHLFSTTAGISFYQAGVVTSVTSLGSLPSVNTWTHIAIVRNSTVVTCYVNGTSTGTTTVGTSSQTAFSTNDPIFIGAYWATVTTARYFFDGYLDEFRITKGVARYTANFTPPTTAFLLQ